jgi:hypothetical protein
MVSSPSVPLTTTSTVRASKASGAARRSAVAVDGGAVVVVLGLPEVGVSSSQEVRRKRRTNADRVQYA